MDLESISSGDLDQIFVAIPSTNLAIDKQMKLLLQFELKPFYV
jgi:hypothetical protein